MLEQLSLNVQLRDDATFDNFIVGNNQLLIQQLHASLSDRQERFLYVWGETGVGKTHLLQACCHAMSQQGLTASYLPLSDNAELSPSILQQLETLTLVCIDDVDAIVAKRAWEEALFHLYNSIRQQQETCLLITGSHSPKQLGVELADLSSRLAGSLVFQVRDLADQAKCEALIKRAQKRGLALPYHVAEFLLARCSRNMADLYRLLEHLDQASLRQQRRLTIPFVKDVLSSTNKNN